MSKILPFLRKMAPQADETTPVTADFSSVLQGFSIEVMPRTAAKIDDFRALLPAGTRVYIAHIDGTPIEEMQATARRLVDEGFEVMPHLPARSIPDRATFDDWIRAYADLGVTSALMLAGGRAEPAGEFDASMQLLETGIMDKHGFTRLHVAGHPEGNRDIDVAGGDAGVMEALRWKQGFSERSDAQFAIATQFLFEADPAVAWAKRLKSEGISLPIHLGVAGPAKLQTLVKFAMACGVGASVSVLQKRAKDITKLMLPFTPDDVLAGIMAHPDLGQTNIEAIHIFPLGGIRPAAEYLAGATAQAASAG